MRLALLRYASSGPVRILAMLVAVAVLGLASYRTWLWWTAPTDPPAVRAFEENRESVRQYVRSIREGRVPQREGGQGYYLLDVLYPKGLRYVREEDGCLVFLFEGFVTDPVPTLIYSPRGEAGLPRRYTNEGGTYHIFEFRRLDDEWYFLYWD
jgi:hypothetical protein